MVTDHARLIEALYASLSDGYAFRQFMHSLATSFRSHLVATQMDTMCHQHRPLTHYGSDGNHCTDLDARYISTEIQNPWFAAEASARLRALGTLSDNGIVSASDLRRTEFYAHVLRPLDVFHSIGFLLDETEDGLTFLSISRSALQGPYTNDEERLARYLLPHMRNLQSIQRSLVTQATTVLEGEDLLMTLDDRGRVIDTLAEGKPELRSLFAYRDRRIMPAQLRDRPAWQQTLLSMASNQRLEGLVTLSDSRAGYAATARLSRLPERPHLVWMLRDTAKYLLLVRSHQVVGAHVEMQLRSRFQLTSAEVRVALALYEMEKLSMVAQSLDRSQETVRSHLKTVFGKTGVNSQVQLIALLGRLSSQYS